MIDCIALFEHLPEIMVITVIPALVAGIHYLIERAFHKKKETPKETINYINGGFYYECKEDH